jgi:hypothetical protein
MATAAGARGGELRRSVAASLAAFGDALLRGPAPRAFLYALIVFLELALVASLKSRILASPRCMVRPETTTLGALPDFVPPDVARALAEVRAPRGAVDRRSRSRRGSPRGVRAHPWVRRVAHVGRSYPSRVAVDVELRRPFALVDVEAWRLTVDREGVVLDDRSSRAPAGLPVVRSDKKATPGVPRVGRPFRSPAVLRGLSVLRELARARRPPVPARFPRRGGRRHGRGREVRRRPAARTVRGRGRRLGLGAGRRNRRARTRFDAKARPPVYGGRRLPGPARRRVGERRRVVALRLPRRMTAAPVAVAGPTSTAGRPTNLVVTRFTLAFAAVSAAASLLPLFAAGAFATPPRGLDRGASLAWYGLSLACFFGCVAPARDGARSRAFAAALGDALRLRRAVRVRARRGRGLRVGRRVDRSRAPRRGAGRARRDVAAPARGVRSGGRPRRVRAVLRARRRAARGPARRADVRRRTAVRGRVRAFADVVDLPAGDAPRRARRGRVVGGRRRDVDRRPVRRALRPQAGGGRRRGRRRRRVRLRSRAAGFARRRADRSAGRPRRPRGARTPLRVVKPAGALELRFATEIRRLPADATTVDLLVVLTPRRTRRRTARGRRGAARAAAVRDLARVDRARGRRDAPRRGRRARAAAETPAGGFAVRDLGDAAGLDASALEGFDVLALEAAAYAALPAADVARFDRYAAEGGTLLLLGARPAGAPAARLDGEGRRMFGGALAELDATSFRRRVPDATDPALRSVFLRPDWARVDLGRLAAFLVLYHVAFLLAFLLPWRLDAHKSSNVYLVSVGFVLVVVVLGGRAALRSFFLRDNQVATQSFTAALFDADPRGAPRALVRQWRSFASMSGETRDLPLPAPGRTTVYRDRARPPLPFSDDGPIRLAGVALDRFDAHVLLREDRVDPAPLAVTEEPRVDATVFRIAPTAGAPDPARLRFATPRRAWLWDGVGAAVEGAPDGPWAFRFAAAGATAAPGTGANGPPVEVRAVVARSVPPRPGDLPVRRLVVTLDGAARLDDPSSYFNVEDRGAVLIFDVPASR